MSDQLLTERELAERWRMSYETLRSRRGRKQSVIPFVRIGRSVRYRLADVERAERAHIR